MKKLNPRPRRERGWKSWFRSYFEASHAAGGFTRRMRLESLEPRWVRSSFAVTDNSDSATDVNSLRYAIDNLAAGTAASTNTITIESNLVGGQIITLGSTLDINQGVTITGAGRNTVSSIDNSVWISGNNAVGVFKVESGVNASFAGVNITKGTAAEGGGIDNLGTLSISNCSLSFNTATSTSSAGGGIYNGSGTLSVANSWIGNNQAPSATASGGGLYNQSGSVSITNSTISGNSAGPFAQWSGGIGGGVVNEAGTLSITNSTVEGNLAGTSGGGIDNQSTTSLANCTLSGNEAGSSGGALYNGSGSLSIADCTISGNSIWTNNASGFAGGIDNTATATLQNSIVSNNSAPISPDAAGGFTDQGNNLLGTALDTGSPPASDVFTNNPGLMPASRYDGGSLDTMSLFSWSPAIKAGSVLGGGIPTTDQLDDPRPTTGPIDIGAVQYLGVGSITGTVFDDLNGNGSQDPGEGGIPGVTVYLDMTHSGQLDAYDPSAVTDGNGHYTFSGVQVGLLGSYTVREQAFPGSANFTTPAGGSATVNLTTAAPTATVDFGQIQTGGALPVVTHPNLYKNNTSDAGISYIKSLYQAILDRQPGVLEYETWVEYLDSLGGVANIAARQDLANEIWNAPEHRVNEVDAYYQSLLGRSGVGDSGAMFWANELEAGVGELSVVQAIMSSAEYQNKTAGNNTLFVENLLGELGVAGGNKGPTTITINGSPLDLLAALDSGLLNRTQVVSYAVASDQALLATVGVTYQGYLQRLPGVDAGWAYWAEEIRIHGVQYVGVAIFASPEYFHDIQANL